MRNILDIGTEAAIGDRSGESDQLVAAPRTDVRADGNDRSKIIGRTLRPPVLLLVQAADAGNRDRTYLMRGHLEAHAGIVPAGAHRRNC